MGEGDISGFLPPLRNGTLWDSSQCQKYPIYFLKQLTNQEDNAWVENIANEWLPCTNIQETLRVSTNIPVVMHRPVGRGGVQGVHVHPPFRLKFLNYSMQRNKTLCLQDSHQLHLSRWPPSMMQVFTNIINLKHIRLYVLCPLACTFFTCTPLSMSLATGLMHACFNFFYACRVSRCSWQ